jgi:hypothetical protein
VVLPALTHVAHPHDSHLIWTTLPPYHQPDYHREWPSGGPFRSLIKGQRGLDRLVAKQAAHRLIVSGFTPEIDEGADVAKLVCGDGEAQLLSGRARDPGAEAAGEAWTEAVAAARRKEVCIARVPKQGSVTLQIEIDSATGSI